MLDEDGCSFTVYCDGGTAEIADRLVVQTLSKNKDDLQVSNKVSQLSP